MGKRRRVAVAHSRSRRGDHETNSDAEYSDCGSVESSYREASPIRKTKRKRVEKKSEPAAPISSRQRSTEHKSDVLSHSPSWHTIQSPGAIRIALLRWYAGVHKSRGMPWRKPYDPLQGPEERGQRAYEVWISEIMLQQTQVVTVIPYYTRWMEKFPTICDLASANIDDVNALWKGLGYYSRASRLLAGAQKAVSKYQGRLPDNAKDMEADIPGIGRYSAGAIASIAYGEHVPVLDGNVHRLFSRFLAIYAPPKKKATLDVLWAAAAVMVGSKESVESKSLSSSRSNQANDDQSSIELVQHPGDINQALIELGSTVCKVRDPMCETCPIRPWCRAYEVSKPGHVIMPIPDIEDSCTLCERLQESGVTAYPMKVDRKKPREELDIVNVIEWRSMAKPRERWFLLVRRPDGGKNHLFFCLLAGLFEFPTSSNVAKTTSRTTQAKTPNTLLSQYLVPSVLPYDAKEKADACGERLRIIDIESAEDVVHVFSHIKKTYRPQWVVLEGGKTPPTLRNSNTPTPTLRKAESINYGEDDLSTSLRPSDSMWVQLKDVSSVNMGTGVVKVWTSTKKLWEMDIGGS